MVEGSKAYLIRISYTTPSGFMLPSYLYYNNINPSGLFLWGLNPKGVVLL